MSRPTMQFMRRDYEKVAVLAAAGMSEREIATVLDIARNTLRTHFHDELANGRVRCRAQVLIAVYEAARARGNIAAARTWLSITEQAATPAPAHLRVVGDD